LDVTLRVRAGGAVQSGNTAVHYAAKFGHLDLVELLLGCGRPIEVTMLNKVRATLPFRMTNMPPAMPPAAS
jgi:hypothetical protein